MTTEDRADRAAVETGPSLPSPDRRAPVDAWAPATRRSLPLHGATLLVLAIGLVVSAGLAIATRQVYEGNENRLLDQRLAEANAVIQAALPGIQTPLAAGAELAEVGDGVDNEPFRRLMEPLVEQRRFVSASIWPLDAPVPAPVFVVGAPPALAARPPEQIRAFLDRSAARPMLGVLGLLEGAEPRLGYSFTAVRTSGQPPARFMAYAENPLPADRTSVVRRDDAFRGLDSTIYLGDTESPDRLLTSTTPDLPLGGRRASKAIPFGDSTLLLVMAPTEHQGGRLLAVLPWLLLGGGLLVTAGAAVLVERLLRRRDQTERLAAEIAGLYEEQHRVAHTLQHSLLPASLPVIAHGELAVRYMPGVEGMEIGGDWYDAVVLDDRRVVLVVGDVSGRGLRAAGVMASLRFAARAFASQGDDPAVILRKLNDLSEPDVDGHFATVVCVAVDLERRTATAASAGHPQPILVDELGGHLLETVPGPPVGVQPGAGYRAIELPLPRAGTLLLFTDGLFERRAESVDVGLDRLRRAAARVGPIHAAEELDELLDDVVASLVAADAVDDAAVLVLRWPGRSGPPEQGAETSGASTVAAQLPALGG